MSASMPSFGAALSSVLRLQLKRTVRGRKLRLGAVAVVLVVAGAVAARYAVPSADPVAITRSAIDAGFFTLLVYLLPFLFNSGAIAEEVESRTFAFVMSRPVPRSAIVLGKFLAGALVSVALLSAGILLLHVACLATTPTPLVDELGPTLRSMGAVALLACFYSAVCTLWGALVVEAAGLLSTIYLAAVEFAFSFVPGVFRFVSMNHHARQLAGYPKGGFFPDVVPDIPLWISGVAPAALMLLYLALATLVVRTAEYRFGKA